MPREVDGAGADGAAAGSGNGAFELGFAATECTRNGVARRGRGGHRAGEASRATFMIIANDATVKAGRSSR